MFPKENLLHSTILVVPGLVHPVVQVLFYHGKLNEKQLDPEKVQRLKVFIYRPIPAFTLARHVKWVSFCLFKLSLLAPLVSLGSDLCGGVTHCALLFTWLL